MNVKTKYHGEITIEEKDIIHFNQGIPGFLDEKKFIIIPLEEDNVFQILQSVETPALAFVMTDPFSFFKDYEFDLDDASIAKLEIESEQDILIYSILNVHEVFEQSTVNLQAPLVINSHKQLGKQVILSNTPYQTKHTFINHQDKVRG